MKKISLALVLALCACKSADTGPAPTPAPTQDVPATPPPPAPVDESFRATPPAAGPVPAMQAPLVKKTVLANGMTVLVVEKAELPLVSLRVVVMSGSAADPKVLPGVAGFVGDMLKSGTKTRSATAIADEVETLGAALEVAVDEDTTQVSFSSLEENYGAIFDVVADVITGSTFAKDEIEKVRKRRLAAIEQQKDEPSATASRVFSRALFGDYPYGHAVLGTTAAVQKIDQSQLRTFFAEHFRPANAAVVVVGAVREADAVAAVQKRLGAWKGKPGIAAPPAAPTERVRKLVLVDKAGAPQSQLRIGEISAARTDPDYFKLVMMNAVLGGLFNSRINMNLREEKGYTYGARTAFEFSRGPSPFITYTGVRTDVTAPALREVFNEIERMQKDGVTEAELTNAKNSYSLSLPSLFQTTGAVSAMAANLYVNALPLDYYQTLPQALAAVSTQGVHEVAKGRLHPEAMSVVVVGDAAAVEPSLNEIGLGSFVRWTADGEPLKK